MKRIFILSLLLLVMVTAFAFTTRIISGTIMDDAGNPIIAQITLKGTKNSISTNRNGGFSIQVGDNKSPILVVTSLGYETKEVPVGKNNRLTIHLQAAVSQLQDVTVMGYGVARKKDLTGAVPLNSMAINQVNTAYAQPFVGRVAGMQVSGSPKMRTKHDTMIDGEFSPKREYNREGYDPIVENPFLAVTDNPLSTFSIDVDAASYSNVRRILNSGHLPDAGAVRIEEMVNYFSYEYAQPTGKDPFAVHTELAVCPWNTKHQLVLIGLQGKKTDASELPASNLTFLIDVSGSMFSPDKLPLVKASLKLLVDQLRPQDRVAIVAYAGNAGLVLPATAGNREITIKEAIDRLEAGGSTAGGAGIQLAYKIAKENFIKDGNNRVILCTDGDFNVGLSSDDALERMIEEERKSGVFLTVLGYGTGNYQDAKMQKLADKGNGNHAYIDGINEAKKVLINEFGGTLFTIAKDVKLQVEFNPAKVKGYRLIGYENRMLTKEDFNDDAKDAGDLGSGHTVTAIYELIPPGVDIPKAGKVDSLRYQVMPTIKTTARQAKYSDEVMTVKLRYKEPDGDKSSLLSYPVAGNAVAIEKATDNFRFAAAVASFGMLLRNSDYKGAASYDLVKSMADKALGKDIEGYRKEFLQLVGIASGISGGKEIVKLIE
jgi:Ca-activated chloride channel family protein